MIIDDSLQESKTLQFSLKAQELKKQGRQIISLGLGEPENDTPDHVKQAAVDALAAGLTRAPAGLYDETICADITEYRGNGQADLVICQAVLEHVANTEKALRSIASCLKSGGKALLFVPSRNAVYARLNMIMPDSWRKWIIGKLMPESAHMRGFKAYYDRCTPGQFRTMADQCGFEVVDVKCYFISSYFSHFFPLYVLWRCWMRLFYLCNGENAAETFTMTLRKR